MGNDQSTGKYSDLDSMKKYTDFSPGQVEIIREKFDLMADEDLTISKDQFGKLMKIPPSEIDKIFDCFDTDGSGRIDSYEFISALALLSQATLQEKSKHLFIEEGINKAFKQYKHYNKILIKKMNIFHKEYDKQEK